MPFQVDQKTRTCLLPNQITTTRMNTRLKQESVGKRIPELDGLRGLAILLVLGFHFINNTLVDLPGKLINFLAQVTSVGWAGVDLFFVLSGFLIGSILIRE